MKILLNGREKEVAEAKSVGRLVELLGLCREETLVKVNGKLAADSEAIAPDDEIKVMKVIFGG